MNRTESEFLDVYKHVDKICADMYSSNAGVTEYITQMELKDSIGHGRVSDWDDSYRLLKHLRWMRNQLVHEVNPEECTEEDLDEINAFYRQIMTQQDPLAMLYKVTKPGCSNKALPEPIRGVKADAGKQSQGNTILAVFVLLLIAIIVFMVIMIWKMNH